MSARLLFYRKQIQSEKELIEMKVWEVPRSRRYPEGIKYSLVYIREGQRAVGYDNAEGKGHHRHCGKDQQKYAFEGVDILVRDFYLDVEQCGRGRQ
jgi:hypothetical protein